MKVFVHSSRSMFSLGSWNTYYNELFLPNTILVVIGLIVGVIGNVTVICVYQQGLKNKGNGRFFIPILATVDLMCVSFSAVYHIIQLTHFVTFPNSWVCKFFYYLIRVIITHSIMIMTAIAVTRFHQIGQIMKCQITTSRLRIFIICTGILSFISYIPTLFVFGTVEVYKDNITGYMCKEIMNAARALDKGNLIFTAVLHGTCMFIITVSYVLIAIHIFKKYRQNSTNIVTTETEVGANSKQPSAKKIRRQNSSWSHRFKLMFFTLQVFLLMTLIPPNYYQEGNG